MRHYGRDRASVLLSGLVVSGLGLLLLDWRLGLVVPSGRRLSTTTVTDLMAEGWWPWAQGAGGVLIALVGLMWLLSHRPHRGPRTTGTRASGPTGTVTVDLDSLRAALADRLDASGTTTDARVDLRHERGRLVATLDARADDDTDLDGLVGVAEDLARELRQVLPDDEVVLQTRWRAPRPRRTVRSARASVRVQ
ncbi:MULTISPECIES: hypothetical protein [unclassified Nocardioides]|uniref:hypothetical protein n=1 Tax=unclassified Nocardioides TaxID=2615069 RepID=UPI0030146AA4